jgi:acid phosphatase type 7
MNRRAFLAALGAVAATRHNFGRFRFGKTLTSQTGTAAPATGVTTSRFPYVQNLQSDRASILWATFETGSGSVQYSSDGVNFNTVAATSQVFDSTMTGLPQSFTQYQADLKGLSPNSDYIYRASVDGQDIPNAGDARFHTAGPGPFNFIVLGDSGWGLQSDAQGLIARRILAEKPAMIVHTGDLVYNPSGTYDSYQRNYFNYYASTMSSVPFFPCPGNHDYEYPNAAAYVAIHAVPMDTVPAQDRGRYYSYDWGNVHFVSIDAKQSLQSAINGNSPMLRWLDNDLRSTRQFWKVVYFHFPPFATGNNENDIESAWVRQYIVPILDNNGVQLVLSGHEHSYQRSVPVRRSATVSANAGTNYVTSGGGGAVLYAVPLKSLVAFGQSAYHYLRAEVRGTQMTIHAVRADGVEIDSFSIAPVPAFTDDPRLAPVTLNPGPVAGATLRIIGRALAAEETFLCSTTPPTDMAGTVVTVNGQPVQLLYVSPTQIYAQLPFPVSGNVVVRITTANGFAETSI